MAHDYSTGGLSKKLSCVYCRSPPEPAWKYRRIECLPGETIQGGRGGGVGKGIGSTLQHHADPECV